MSKGELLASNNWEPFPRIPMPFSNEYEAMPAVVLNETVGLGKLVKAEAGGKSPVTQMSGMAGDLRAR
ncbi:hypothetical protein FA13DRAFT_1804010 [Coprinellus micaceus]|uniref:Uncharacterized protein n=1 Tax=Coprinellus micaceus TaxID=71717 RepID=A0A4Y7S9Z2_COPMI|nr:hypothetical protein FA13DRAFT_1804010 [Coprinellus micaceus]